MSEHERLGPPPIEPLSDIAWSRIERGLWSRMDASPPAPRAARPRRWVWIAAPALAAAAAAAAVVVGTSGGASHEGEQVRLVSGAAPTTLAAGDVHLTLDANSAVVMERKGAVLERGAAWFAVSPRGERAPFVVAAGDTVVRVLGTRFRVARDGEEATVEVEHGTVEVKFRGATTRVAGGEQWSSRAPTVATARRVAEADIEIDPEPARPTTPSAGLPARPSSSAPKSSVRSDRPSSGTRTAPVTSPAPTPESPAGRNQRDEDAARYHRLEQLEVRDPRAAIEGYLDLSRRSARWAEPALFAAARLSADRKEARARHLIEIYLTRFPSGANVDDARKLLDHSPQGAPR